jgi:hypothetical protein
MIIDHPTIRHDTRFGSESAKMVQCDFCPTTAPVGFDMHEAVDKARSAGFITIRGRTAISPRKWSCPKCTVRRNTAS